MNEELNCTTKSVSDSSPALSPSQLNDSMQLEDRPQPFPQDNVPACPNLFADPAISQFLNVLQANITELSANNKKLNEVAQRQHFIIQSLDREVKSCRKHIAVLE